jgi:regulatory protein
MNEAELPSQPVVLTTLRESPRNPGRYQVELSDKRRFVVGIDALQTVGLLRTGVELEPATLKRLEHESAVANLVSRGLSMIARARRTRRELELRLRRVEPDKTLVAESLQRLEQAGVIADESVARAEAGARLRRGDGPLRVRQELHRKGIDQRTTDASLAAAIEDDGFDELAACRTLAERRFRSLARLESAVAKRRLIAFLIRRGYTSSTIRTVVDELMQSRG